MSKASSKPASHRIVIVDDHPILRQGLTQLIQSEPGLQVVGEAEDAAGAMVVLDRLKPDLVLVDISLPGRSGIDLLQDLRVVYPNLPVLVLSMHDESLYAERVLRAGARGYIMKDEGGGHLVAAVRKVLAGEVYVSPKMQSRILEQISGSSRRKNTAPTVEGLTDREFEVFRLVGQGKATREIADELHISVKTVEVHRLNIKHKLGVKSAAELVRFAVRWTESEG